MTTTTQKKTCADLINQSWENRKADLDALYGQNGIKEWLTDNGYDATDDDAATQAACEYGLSFEYVPAYGMQPDYFRFLLMTGGPHAEIRFYVTQGKRVAKIEYHYADWFDGATIDITEDPVAQAVAWWFDGSDSFNPEYYAHA
jgi:hypothetical protein